jgi:hypothetical protein
MRWLISAAVSLLLLVPGLAVARVPARFVGVTVDGPALAPTFDLGNETALMARSGVESVRMQFSWAGAQPYASWSAVPDAERGAFVDEGGIPTTYAALDRLVTLAAQRRLTVLPVVQYAPAWAARHPGLLGSPPSSPAPYAAFAGALVRRYGPAGSFWSTHPGIPRVPIRAWEIWNEPDLPYMWSDQPFDVDYLALLKASRKAIKAADPRAQVVLGGFANYSWRTLAYFYRLPGARAAFDAVSVHGYTRQAAGVVTILGRVRATMRRHGDAHKPMLATEVGWPASRGRTKSQFGVETTASGQAARIRTLLPLLARDRRALGLESLYVYTWIGQETSGAPEFQFAGLRRITATGQVQSKPALTAFRRAARALEAR